MSTDTSLNVLTYHLKRVMKIIGTHHLTKMLADLKQPVFTYLYDLARCWGGGNSSEKEVVPWSGYEAAQPWKTKRDLAYLQVLGR